MTDTHAPVSTNVRACRELLVSFIQMCSVWLLNLEFDVFFGVVFRFGDPRATSPE